MRRTYLSWLLRLLPADFRREYGREMESVVVEHREALRGRGRWWRVPWFWVRQTRSILLLALRLRLGGAPPAPRGWDDGTNRSDGRWTMEGFGQDLRHAARSLLREPGFTLVAGVTLALGIGASTAIFSAVHAVLLRDLPYGDADRIVAVFHTDAETGEVTTGASAANMRDLGESAERLAETAVAEPWSLDLQLEDRAEMLRTWAVSEGFFEVLGVEPRLGRSFRPEEYVAGNEKVVLLGHRSWTTRFGADPDLVGRTLILDEEPYTVVGVLPPDFRYPDRAAAWIPRPPRPWDDNSRAADYMTAVAKLTSGATLAEARAEADRTARSLAEAFPGSNANIGLRLVPFREHLVGDVRTALVVLFSAVGLLLLIACANVAGLMLARGARREREYALRSALGAGRARLVRRIGAESLLLAGAGCGLGIALTYAGIEAIQALGPGHLPRIDQLGVDAAVLAFAVLAAGSSALLSGMAPALRLSRPDLGEALSEGARGAPGGRRIHRLRDRLVVAEVAAAVVLLIGAGLLIRSFTVLVDEELGFDPRDRVAVQVFAYDYPEGELAVFVRQAMENMEAVPGVRDVALTTNVPGANEGAIAAIDIDLPLRVEGRAAPPEGREPVAWTSQISAGYFDVMDIPVVAGRGFDDGDRADSRPVAVINEELARRLFPAEDPLGRRIALPWGAGESGEWPWREIVGVAGDVRPLGFESEPRPEVFLPLTQVGDASLTFVLATGGDAESLVRPAQEAIWETNPSQAVWGAATLEALLADWLRERRFNLLLLTAFAGVALLLAAVGIYGLVSFSVEERVPELGIRRALGSDRGTLLRMVIRRGAVLAAAGVALGILGSLLLTRFLEGMLFGVEPTDWPTYVILAGAVLAVATVASLVPALRATRIDPVVALRQG